MLSFYPHISPPQSGIWSLGVKEGGLLEGMPSGSHGYVSQPGLGASQPSFNTCSPPSHLYPEPPLTLGPWAQRGGFPFLCDQMSFPYRKVLESEVSGTWSVRCQTDSTETESSLFFWAMSDFKLIVWLKESWPSHLLPWSNEPWSGRWEVTNGKGGVGVKRS